MQSSFNLKNQLLIAMPDMRDPHFEHTVTLICQHDEKGAFGVTINRPMDIELGDLLTQLDITINNETLSKKLVINGGPVQSEQGFVLHDSDDQWESSVKIGDGLFLTSSKDILTALADDNGPENFLLILGCAGWENGQLEDEIKQNAWLTCPASHELVFKMPYPHRWKGAAASLGIDVNLLSVTAGHA